MYDQNQLQQMSDKLYEDVEFLLDKLSVNYKIVGDRYTGVCPIHGGDNPSALSIHKGRWTCFTHHCEKVFYGSLVGFIRGVLSAKQGWPEGEKVSFVKTLKWVLEFLQIEIKESSIDWNFVKTVNFLDKTPRINEGKITRQQVRARLDFPSPLIDRFGGEVLDKFDIGLCKPGKPMEGRSVVPVYDSSYRYMVGCLGRSIHKKCSTCNLYHSNNWSKCPTYNLQNFSKWTNSPGFYKGSYLFNYWKAKERIIKTGNVILVEGPLDVLRLQENNIGISVAVFGSSMSDEQTILLERLPVKNIVVMMDNDDAGKKAAKQVGEKCKHLAPLHFLAYNAPDIGACSKDEIDKIKLYLEKLK